MRLTFYQCFTAGCLKTCDKGHLLCSDCERDKYGSEGHKPKWVKKNER